MTYRMGNTVRQLEQSDIVELQEDLELVGLSFDGLSLAGFDFTDKLVEDCSFRECVLTDARFNTAVVRSCDFAGAGVQGISLFAATFEECKMMGLDFTHGGVQFDAATFTRVNLDYALLRGTDLSDVRFTACSMHECDLTGANLSGASLIECDLEGVEWASVITSGTDLRGSDTRGIDLRSGPYGVILTTRQAISLVEDLGVLVIDPAE
jgi:fluoroquinolone resistance protein